MWVVVLVLLVNVWVRVEKWWKSVLNEPYASVCKKGSKSFFMASLLYPAGVRKDVFVLYAFARYSDDLIDEPSTEDVKRRIAKLRLASENMYSDASTGRGIPDGLWKIVLDMREVITRRKIPEWILNLLLHGFESDVCDAQYTTLDEVVRYSLGVASSIGLFCNHLFEEDPTPEQEYRAACLGVAFQMTNISRDIWTDKDMGRRYVPWVKDEDKNPRTAQKDAARLVLLAEQYYEDAWSGVEGLPWQVRLAVGSALMIYREIGMQILRQTLYCPRTVVSKKRKVRTVVITLFRLITGQKPKFRVRKGVSIRADLESKIKWAKAL